jgi:hypothetical protein
MLKFRVRKKNERDLVFRHLKVQAFNNLHGFPSLYIYVQYIFVNLYSFSTASYCLTYVLLLARFFCCFAG